MHDAPKEARDAYETMFEAMYDFVRLCCKHDTTPERCMAMIIACTLAILREVTTSKENRQLRDLSVEAVNIALEGVAKTAD